MALLVITEEDIKKSTPPSAGWHLVEIKKYEAKARVAPKTGMEYAFTLEVLRSNPEVNNASEQVGRQLPITFYSTGMGFMIPFISAVLNAPVTSRTEFDPEKFVSRQIMAELVDGIYQNKPTKKWENFAPAEGCPF